MLKISKTSNARAKFFRFTSTIVHHAVRNPHHNPQRPPAAATVLVQPGAKTAVRPAKKRF
jgi:hypothetical protein